jgi:hypothetical protein
VGPFWISPSLFGTHAPERPSSIRREEAYLGAMRIAAVLLALALPAAASAAQDAAPVQAPQQAAPAEQNPYRDLFTPWNGVNRDSMDAETAGTPPPSAPEADDRSVPAYSPLAPRSQAEAVALGERVGAVVRAGDCAEGERIARQAGDFALVRAVQAHCRRAQ